MAENHEVGIEELAPDLVRLRISYVNCYLAGKQRAADVSQPQHPWVLVDTGLPMGAAHILDAAAARYGTDARPSAIILTHGHFDHVGALVALLGIWDVPVYAHALELPFLTGRADFPPPDPSLSRGRVSRAGGPPPERGINIGRHVVELPSSGSVPGMPGWRWIHTPGHSPGHVSLFRAADRLLLAGDAIVTTRPESVFAAPNHRRELNGPPAAFTIDWGAARRSVATLASLKPETIAAGHGDPIRGADVPQQLARLGREFDQRARPRRGRYVSEPAITSEAGVIYVPPPARGGVPWGTVSGVAAAALAGTWLVRRFGRRARAVEDPRD